MIKQISTRTAEISFYSGYVRVNIRPEIKQELRDAKENMDAICKEYKHSLIIDLCKAQPVGPDVRRFYSGQVLVNHFFSLALLVDTSAVGKVMANIYLAVAKPAIPTKVFTDEAAAIKWTEGFIK